MRDVLRLANQLHDIIVLTLCSGITESGRHGLNSWCLQLASCLESGSGILVSLIVLHIFGLFIPSNAPATLCACPYKLQRQETPLLLLAQTPALIASSSLSSAPHVQLSRPALHAGHHTHKPARLHSRENCLYARLLHAIADLVGSQPELYSWIGSVSSRVT